MKTPRNTSEVSPFEVLADAMLRGTDGLVERMEAEGQREIVESETLPVGVFGTDADFEALGFVFGDPVPGDDLFRSATLPQGWSRKGSDHAMWSYIVDAEGRERVSVFYKAAFYDRKAHMALRD